MATIIHTHCGKGHIAALIELAVHGELFMWVLPFAWHAWKGIFHNIRRRIPYYAKFSLTMFSKNVFWAYSKYWPGQLSGEIDIWLDFQIGFSLMKVFLCFVDLVLNVFACYPSWWMVLPRYVKLPVLSNTCSSIVISTGLLALMGMTLVLLLFISSPICYPKCWSLFVFSRRCVCVFVIGSEVIRIVKVFNENRGSIVSLLPCLLCFFS